MNRRTFLYSCCVLSANATFNFEKDFSIPFQSHFYHMTSGDRYIAKPGDIISLPENPKDADYIHIVVDGSSLSNPAKVLSHHMIIGDGEPLVLDTLAIVKLVFEQSTGNWIIS